MTDLTYLYQQHLDQLLTRHREIMRQHDLQYLLVPSGQPIRIYLDDMDYPFKSSFLFRTYLPLSELPHSYLVIGLTGKPSLIYFQPQDYWHTPPSDPEGIWPQHFDIKVVSDRSQAADFFPQNSPQTAILGEATALTDQLTQAQTNPTAVINEIYWQRAYKSDYEMACLTKANQMAARAHRVAEQSFRTGKSEQQIHLSYVEATGMLEHQMPYSNIVALNEHAAVLHYTDSMSRPPAQNLSFLIDAGATFNGYHSDITRTYSAKQDEFADLIAAMDQMQRDCIDSIQIGQCYVDLHLNAHLQISEIIRQFGLVDMSAEGIVESGISASFFPHGLGHLIGLQVHDIGGQFGDQTGTPNPPPATHPFLRCTRKIEERMAYTIEPGLYFIDMLLKQQRQGANNAAFNWQKIEALMPYGGIRIEDDIVIQESGVKNLTREAFAIL